MACCCDKMQKEVIDKQGWYEDDDVLIVHGKNINMSKFIFMDKKAKFVAELKKCIWCGGILDA